MSHWIMLGDSWCQALMDGWMDGWMDGMGCGDMGIL